MGDVLTNRLVNEREHVAAQIQSIEAVAVDQKRDLTGADLESIKTYSARLRDLDAQLEVTTTRLEMDDQVRNRIAAVSPGMSGAASQYRSAGQLLFDVLHMGERESRNRFESVQRRAAEHMGTDAAQTVATAGGMAGLTVAPITGPIIDLKPSGRPFLTALGVQPAPNAFNFMRPRIVDPDFATGVDTQTLQKEELASKKFDVKSESLELSTVGGYLNVSQQLLTFVPQSLDLIVNQLGKRLSSKTETLAVGVASATTNVAPVVDPTDPRAVRAAIFEASAEVFAQTGELAEWILMGPAGWAALGSLVDLAGRPLFPMSAPSNPMGSSSPSTFVISSLGLTGIVTPAITDGSYYVGNGTGFEAYEYRYPVLEAVEPSVLGRQVAVASSLVFYQPITGEPDQREAIVKIPVA